MSDEIDTRLRNVGVIPILRQMPETQMERIVAAVLEAGGEAIEITLDSAGALDAIRWVRAQYGDRVLLGAGTVMSLQGVAAAREAGAAFILSPHLDLAVVKAALQAGLSVIPGVFTPTEIAAAERAGARLLKLFPAGSVGPGYLKDLLGPFGGRAFFPTGGITPENATAYIRGGAIGVGMGSSLVRRDEVERGEWEAITVRVRDVLHAVREAKTFAP